MKLIDKDALVAEIEDRINKEIQRRAVDLGYSQGHVDSMRNILSFLDTLEEAVSEKLEKAAEEWDESLYRSDAFKAGAKWQKEHLWKSADGDDLPMFDREVIVFIQPDPLEGNEYAVSFAHRSNPDGWDGKSIITGKIEHYTPKTYDKGGWNIPNVKWWLDCLMPIKEYE